METSGLLLVSVFCNMQRTPSNICKDKSNFPKNTFFYFVFMIIYETGNIAKYSIICMFRKHFEAIVPFSEIIFVLLQAYLPIYI